MDTTPIREYVPTETERNEMRNWKLERSERAWSSTEVDGEGEWVEWDEVERNEWTLDWKL